ncbi:MAG: DNA-directed RNA polymerase subunit alpha C-terminal domain-containing protein [Planctomycetota bacterium]
MTQDTVRTEEQTTRPFDPAETLAGDLSFEKLERLRREAFRSIRSIEQLKDWHASPSAQDVPRAIAAWCLGRHAEAIEALAAKSADPVVAWCLAQSHIALGNPEEAVKLLSQKTRDAHHANVWLQALEALADPDAFEKALREVSELLSPTDRRYAEGRLLEMRHDPVGAIAAYDQVLAQDPTHQRALFRLALNVDLRGEDEEARELYERALMSPPVNSACVMNLGILYEDMGNYRRAMQCFDLALQANPANERARLFRRDAVAALNMYYDEDQERREDKRNKILRTPINDFELSVRSRNCLAKMNIRTLGDLVKKTEAELLSYKNFGETSLQEIKEILKNKSLHLGMTADELMSRDLGEPVEPAAPVEGLPDPNSPDPARRPITELDLSVRSRRIVDLLKIRTIGDLAQKTEGELLACPNFGQTSLNEIKTKLDELGLSLRG